MALHRIEEDVAQINTIVTMTVEPDGTLGYDLGSKVYNSVLHKRLDFSFFAPGATAEQLRIALAYLESVYDTVPVMDANVNEMFIANRQLFKDNKKRDDAIIKQLKQNVLDMRKTGDMEEDE